MTSVPENRRRSRTAQDVEGLDLDVVVLGAGFAGIGMGLQLARQGDVSFLVLERADDVGGTWRDNRYPGVASDIPAHLYSLSFQPKSDWSRVFAPGAEIQEYLRECARSDGLSEHIRLGAEVLGAQWHEEEARWHISTTRGVCTANALIVAAGRLSEPRRPDVPGLDSFDGTVFHSAAWPHELDLSGLRVGVVGTGASAVQLLPHIVESAAQAVVFQRSAPWVVPRDDRAYTDDEIRGFGDDAESRVSLRTAMFAEAELGFAARKGPSEHREALRERAMTQLRDQVSDPLLRERLTPDYEIGCKRVLISDDFYPAVTSSNAVLEPSALAQIHGSRAVAASGLAYDLDLIVLATGFHATRPPFAHWIRGVNGQLLAEHWQDGMTAYASTVVTGFPNLFVIDGPNASLGHNSAVHMIETQIGYILGALEHLGSGQVLEVRPEAEAQYTQQIDAAARSTVWLTGGCSSWYRDEASGRLTLLWPGTATSFSELHGTFAADPFVQRRVEVQRSAG